MQYTFYYRFVYNEILLKKKDFLISIHYKFSICFAMQTLLKHNKNISQLILFLKHLPFLLKFDCNWLQELTNFLEKKLYSSSIYNVSLSHEKKQKWTGRETHYLYFLLQQLKKYILQKIIKFLIC